MWKTGGVRGSRSWGDGGLFINTSVTDILAPSADGRQEESTRLSVIRPAVGLVQRQSSLLPARVPALRRFRAPKKPDPGLKGIERECDWLASRGNTCTPRRTASSPNRPNGFPPHRTSRPPALSTSPGESALFATRPFSRPP